MFLTSLNTIKSNCFFKVCAGVLLHCQHFTWLALVESTVCIVDGFYCKRHSFCWTGWGGVCAQLWVALSLPPLLERGHQSHLGLCDVLLLFSLQLVPECIVLGRFSCFPCHPRSPLEELSLLCVLNPGAWPWLLVAEAWGKSQERPGEKSENCCGRSLMVQG